MESGGAFRGRFLLTPWPESRPTLSERLVAVAVADQVGAALAGYEASHRRWTPADRGGLPAAADRALSARSAPPDPLGEPARTEPEHPEEAPRS